MPQESGAAAELRSLHTRLLEIERERAVTYDHARLLEELQSTFSLIARLRSPDDIVALGLRAVHVTLGFSRAIFFSVERECGIVARFQIDGNDGVEVSHERVDLRPDGALLAALRDPSADGVGLAGELSAPLVDVRGWYVVSPLFGVDGALGVLYADGHRSAALPREREVDAVRALTAIAAVALDNAALFARTQALAVRDPLTGLFNRRALSERLAAEIAASDRERRTFGYVMVDVDDFKRVNDRRGHAAGDAVLRLVADTLVRGSRAGDIVARYAGDEFVILLSNIDPELARALVSRLSAELRRQGLRCSIGAALYPRDAAGAEELAAAADRALYATKATGKDGFSFA